MRGDDGRRQTEMWSYVPLEQRVPADYPLRPSRQTVDDPIRDATMFTKNRDRSIASAIAPEFFALVRAEAA